MKKKGFTLIELLVVIFIIMILMSAIITTSVVVLNKKKIEKAEKTVEINVNSIVQSIKNENGIDFDKLSSIGVKKYFNLQSPEIIKNITIEKNEEKNVIFIEVISNEEKNKKQIKSQKILENLSQYYMDKSVYIKTENGEFKLDE